MFLFIYFVYFFLFFLLNLLNLFIYLFIYYLFIYLSIFLRCVCVSRFGRVKVIVGVGVFECGREGGVVGVWVTFFCYIVPLIHTKFTSIPNA